MIHSQVNLYFNKCLVGQLLSQALWLEKSFQEFYGKYQDLIEKYQRSIKKVVSNSFPRQSLFYIRHDFDHFCCFTWICHLDLSMLNLIASLLSLEHLVILLPGPISHTTIQCMDYIEMF